MHGQAESQDKSDNLYVVYINRTSDTSISIGKNNKKLTANAYNEEIVGHKTEDGSEKGKTEQPSFKIIRQYFQQIAISPDQNEETLTERTETFDNCLAYLSSQFEETDKAKSVLKSKEEVEKDLIDFESSNMADTELPVQTAKIEQKFGSILKAAKPPDHFTESVQAKRVDGQPVRAGETIVSIAEPFVTETYRKVVAETTNLESPEMANVADHTGEALKTLVSDANTELKLNNVEFEQTNFDEFELGTKLTSNQLDHLVHTAGQHSNVLSFSVEANGSGKEKVTFYASEYVFKEETLSNDEGIEKVMESVDNSINEILYLEKSEEGYTETQN